MKESSLLIQEVQLELIMHSIGLLIAVSLI